MEVEEVAPTRATAAAEDRAPGEEPPGTISVRLKSWRGEYLRLVLDCETAARNQASAVPGADAGRAADAFWMLKHLIAAGVHRARDGNEVPALPIQAI